MQAALELKTRAVEFDPSGEVGAVVEPRSGKAHRGGRSRDEVPAVTALARDSRISGERRDQVRGAVDDIDIVGGLAEPEAPPMTFRVDRYFYALLLVDDREWPPCVPRVNVDVLPAQAEHWHDATRSLLSPRHRARSRRPCSAY